MVFIILTNDEAFLCKSFFLVHWQITIHAFYLWSYEIEIRNSLFGYKNQLTIMCGNSLLVILKDLYSA